jgi:hypothetical protein
VKNKSEWAEDSPWRTHLADIPVATGDTSGLDLRTERRVFQSCQNRARLARTEWPRKRRRRAGPGLIDCTQSKAQRAEESGEKQLERWQNSHLQGRFDTLPDAYDWSRQLIRPPDRAARRLEQSLARVLGATQKPESLAAKSLPIRRAGLNLVDCSPSEAPTSTGNA